MRSFLTRTAKSSMLGIRVIRAGIRKRRIGRVLRRSEEGESPLNKRGVRQLWGINMERTELGNPIHPINLSLKLMVELMVARAGINIFEGDLGLNRIYLIKIKMFKNRRLVLNWIIIAEGSLIHHNEYIRIKIRVIQQLVLS